MEYKKSCEYTIDTSSINGENAVILIYEESFVGYLEKVYKGKVHVFINKIHDNGKLEIEIK